MIRQVIGWTYGREDWYLLRELTVAQFKIRDRSTFLGFLWSVLHPVLMAAILIAVFRNRLGSDILHFELYVLVGMVHYTYFANATSASMRALLTVSMPLLQIVLVAAISLALAVTFPLLRDLDHLYQISLRVLLFATPIFYQRDVMSSRLFD